MGHPAIIDDVMLPDGQVETSRLSKRLKVTKTELALAAGLSRHAVSRTARLASPATQGRLRDMVEIVNRVLAWAGSVPQAFAWDRAQSLPCDDRSRR